MPFIDFKCPKCGYKTEELVKVGEQFKCPKCGEIMQQNYNGKCYVNTQKMPKCSGNCAKCKGCH